MEKPINAYSFKEHRKWVVPILCILFASGMIFLPIAFYAVYRGVCTFKAHKYYCEDTAKGTAYLAVTYQMRRLDVYDFLVLPLSLCIPIYILLIPIDTRYYFEGSYYRIGERFFLIFLCPLISITYLLLRKLVNILKLKLKKDKECS